jgi:hypothetical protein
MFTRNLAKERTHLLWRGDFKRMPHLPEIDDGRLGSFRSTTPKAIEA